MHIEALGRTPSSREEHPKETSAPSRHQTADLALRATRLGEALAGHIGLSQQPARREPSRAAPRPAPAAWAVAGGWSPLPRGTAGCDQGFDRKTTRADQGMENER